MEAVQNALLILALVIVTGFVAAAAMATKPEPTPLKTAYESVWSWCGERFPYRDDLQEACRWGAYEMLPGQDVPVQEKGTHDA